MERIRIGKIQIRNTARALIVLGCILMSSCSSKFMKYDNEEKLKSIEEFDSTVKIEAPSETSSPAGDSKKSEAASSAVIAPSKKVSKSKKKTTAKRLSQKKGAKDEIVASSRREPDLEDDEGFNGRRPIVDPFRVGEKVVHSVRYFKMEAGTLALKVDPFVQVNGRRSYSFVTEIKTGSMFSSFYSVDDKAVTLVDYDLLIPSVFTLHVKETKQLREARSFFDFQKNEAKYWEKKVTDKDGVEEKKQQWEILPYSQNVFSAIFYMRTFKWDLNKDYAFRVADDEQNIVFKGRAIRREVLETELGKMKAIVVKPEISVKGVFKPMGDIFIWLSDDDRKLVLRIESKIKIGTLVSEVVSINPGN